jgi:MOSC domain-containing protein YiiM
MAEILRLFVCPVQRQPMREVVQLQAIENCGLEGCAHGRPGSKRQVLLMDMETLDALAVEPGRMKENIVTRGLSVQSLRGGQRQKVGDALLEVTIPCEPCNQMDEIRPGLQVKLRGRRGMLCRVLEGGLIRRGDAIEMVEDHGKLA